MVEPVWKQPRENREMDQGGWPKRRQPLQRKTRLRSTSAKNRVSQRAEDEARRTTRHKNRADKPGAWGRKDRKNNIPEPVRAAVRFRSTGLCERCGTAEYRSGGLEMHHRLMRSQGGQHTEENLIDLCPGCHAWVHANPAQAYDLGLLRRSWEGMPNTPWEKR